MYRNGFSSPGISKIVVGIDSLKQLKEIVTSIKNSFNQDLYLTCEDELLINPQTELSVKIVAIVRQEWISRLQERF